ncbi:MAG: SPOR domain-containing protein [Asticcacaulis sp.]
MRFSYPISLTAKLGLCLMALSLSGCGAATEDGRFFQNLAERLSEIEIEEKPKDVAVQTDEAPVTKGQVLKTAGLTVVDMALDMAGSETAKPSGQKASTLIHIVNPLDLPRPDADTVLDTGIDASTVVSLVANRSPAPQKPAQAAAPTVALAAAPANVFKTIQIGSFSSEQRAQQAWLNLQAQYPDMERLKPVMQPVTLASGASVVRLRLGPVENDDQARRLCAQLEITDNWCAKAG